MKPNLLIICPEGVAVSKMIAIQLKRMFEFESIQTIGLRKFKRAMMADFDFVISTVDLPDMQDAKVPGFIAICKRGYGITAKAFTDETHQK